MPKTRKNNQASIDYWRKREEAAKAAYVKEEAAYQKQVDEIYRNMYAEIQNEINAFYGKYAAAEGITIAEAKKRVSQLDIDEYSRKAERYVREKNFSKIANEEMKLYNLTMKVNRLELLKAKINLELVAGFDEVEKKTAEALLKRTMDEYKRQAGILGDSVGNQSKSASLIVNASFHNATFSEDIWMYQDALRNSLNTLLQRGMVQGKHPRELARDIEKQFGSSRYEAERLMRTELSRVQTEAAKETFKANDYGQYIFLPHSDACNVCLAIKDEVYNVADMEIGVNAPPMHPNCRCSIAAYMDRAEFEKWLDAQIKPQLSSTDWLQSSQPTLSKVSKPFNAPVNKKQNGNGERNPNVIKFNKAIRASEKMMETAPGYRNIIRRLFAELPNEAQVLINKVFAPNTITDVTALSNVFDPTKKTVSLNYVVDMGQMVPGRTWLHELAHVISDHLGNPVLPGSKFRKALDSDWDNILYKMKNYKKCSTMKETYEALTEHFYEMSKQYGPLVADVVDIVEAMSGGKVTIAEYAHGKAYWEENVLRIAEDAFANMVSSLSNKQLEAIMKMYFPNTFEEMLSILKEGAKNV